MASHQAPCPWDSRQEHWSGSLFPSPMHESESEVAQLCPTPSHPMEWSPPGSCVHGIFQARVLEWVAIAFSIEGESSVLKYLPRGPFGWRVPQELRKDDSLWCPTVPSELIWATGSGEFVVDGGRSNGKRPLSWSWSVLQKRECREKRKREKEREKGQYSSGYVENQ